MDFLHAHNGQRATLGKWQHRHEALDGRVFEVNTNDEIVWDYVAPMYHYNEIFDAGVTLCQSLGTLRFSKIRSRL